MSRVHNTKTTVTNGQVQPNERQPAGAATSADAAAAEAAAKERVCYGLALFVVAVLALHA